MTSSVYGPGGPHCSRSTSPNLDEASIPYAPAGSKPGATAFPGTARGGCSTSTATPRPGDRTGRRAGPRGIASPGRTGRWSHRPGRRYNRDFIVWTGHFVSLLSMLGGWGGVLPPHFGQKKAGDLFQISCSVCRCVSGGYLVVKVRDKLTRCIRNNKPEVYKLNLLQQKCKYSLTDISLLFKIPIATNITSATVR